MAAVHPLFSLKKALSHFQSKQPKFALYTFSLRGGLDQDFLLCSLFDPAPFVSAWEKSIIIFVFKRPLCVVLIFRFERPASGRRKGRSGCWGPERREAPQEHQGAGGGHRRQPQAPAPQQVCYGSIKTILIPNFLYKNKNNCLNRRSSSSFTGLYTGPYFSQTGNPENVTVQLGETARLPCVVRQIGKKTVSGWKE